MKRWVRAGFAVLLVAACAGKSERDSEDAEPIPSAVPDPPPRPGLCRSNADCVVAAPCCGACGTLTGAEAVPLARTAVEAFHESCAASGEPCTDCFRESNPYLVPFCEHQMCHVLDLSRASFVECETGDDCTLRANECCADDTTTFIAVSATRFAELDELLCDGQPPPVNCRVEAPMHQRAVCREGRCSSAFFEL